MIALLIGYLVDEHFSFRALNTLAHCLLASKFSDEKPVDNHNQRYWLLGTSTSPVCVVLRLVVLDGLTMTRTTRYLGGI